MLGTPLNLKLQINIDILVELPNDANLLLTDNAFENVHDVHYLQTTIMLNVTV